MNNSLQNQQEEIIDTFDMFDDWLEKYQYIIDLGKQLEPMDDALKVDENILHGCQSQVWLVHDFNNGHLNFQASSDAAIVSGLIHLVMTIYSGQTPEKIIATEPEFIERIGLSSHLSSTRSNGLNAMIEKIKATAQSYK
ncbi:SufE family protein [Marinicella sp. S1101]|uniref:SufE family protein n=1 Tax=Marinicella marina TaxID=2996016 RepID=UPI002260AEE9|nr:SufE family protein [Marinicella marina]MCX7554834.1 SufE family protein [Marinicella marina]MDJ1140933.1 SufE family protein [Marinicella marina]